MNCQRLVSSGIYNPRPVVLYFQLHEKETLQFHPLSPSLSLPHPHPHSLERMFKPTIQQTKSYLDQDDPKLALETILPEIHSILSSDMADAMKLKCLVLGAKAHVQLKQWKKAENLLGPHYKTLDPDAMAPLVILATVYSELEKWQALGAIRGSQYALAMNKGNSEKGFDFLLKAGESYVLGKDPEKALKAFLAVEGDLRVTALKNATRICTQSEQLGRIWTELVQLDKTSLDEGVGVLMGLDAPGVLARFCRSVDHSQDNIPLAMAWLKLWEVDEINKDRDLKKELKKDVEQYCDLSISIKLSPIQDPSTLLFFQATRAYEDKKFSQCLELITKRISLGVPPIVSHLIHTLHIQVLLQGVSPVKESADLALQSLQKVDRPDLKELALYRRYLSPVQTSPRPVLLAKLEETQDPFTYLELALQQWHANEIKPALESFTLAVQLDPTFALGYFHFGCFLLAQKQQQQASKSFQAGFKLDPLCGCMVPLAQMLHSVDQQVVCAQMYTRVAGIRDRQTLHEKEQEQVKFALLRLGEMQLLNAKVDAAVDSFQGAVALGCKEAWVGLAQAYLRAERYTAAQGAFEVMRDQGVYGEYALVRAAEFHLRIMGHPEEALNLLDEASLLVQSEENTSQPEINANTISSIPLQGLRDEALLALAYQHHATGRLTRAREIVQDLVNTSPHLSFKEKGDACGCVLQDWLQAKHLYQLQVNQCPEEARGHFDLGVSMQHLGEEEALQVFEQAVRLDPLDAMCWNGLGVAHSDVIFKQHCFCTALDLVGEMEEAWLNLGWVYLGAQKEV